MEDIDINEQISHLLSGKLPEDEERKIQDRLKNDPEYRTLFKSAYITWRQLSMQYDQDSFQPEQAWKKAFPQQKQGRVRYIFPKIAAAATVLMLIGAWAYLFTGEKEKQAIVVTDTTIVRTPRGSHAFVTLPDKSTVWLNADSEVKYNTGFSENRTIELEGEAIFDVMPDSTRVFTVVTEGMDIKVLGTSFEVKAYPDEPDMEVAVITGLVGIRAGSEDIRLRPNQRLLLDKATGGVRTDSVDVSKMTGWKDGKLFFLNIPLENICQQLERMFDVEILIHNPALKKERFYVDFINGENINQILQVLNVENNWTIQYDRNRIIIR